MIAEPLNKVLLGKSYDEMRKILYLYNKPFKNDYLYTDCWMPSESDKEYMSEESYNSMVNQFNLLSKKIIFKI